MDLWGGEREQFLRQYAGRALRDGSLASRGTATEVVVGAHADGAACLSAHTIPRPRIDASSSSVVAANCEVFCVACYAAITTR